MHQLILASQSPRRRELLEKAGFCFTVETVKVSEIIDESLNLRPAIERLAYDKAQALIELRKDWKFQSILVLSADTVVAIDGQVLGKPADTDEARKFLRLLSGRGHRVVTGICVWDLKTSRWITASDETMVEFRHLTDGEVDEYIATGEPFDKAGAYAIQGGGRAFVQKIEGSLSNVIGLPIELLDQILSQGGWQIERRTN